MFEQNANVVSSAEAASGHRRAVRRRTIAVAAGISILLSGAPLLRQTDARAQNSARRLFAYTAGPIGMSAWDLNNDGNFGNDTKGIVSYEWDFSYEFMRTAVTQMPRDNGRPAPVSLRFALSAQLMQPNGQENGVENSFLNPPETVVVRTVDAVAPGPLSVYDIRPLQIAKDDSISGGALNITYGVFLNGHPIRVRQDAGDPSVVVKFVIKPAPAAYKPEAPVGVRTEVSSVLATYDKQPSLWATMQVVGGSGRTHSVTPFNSLYSASDLDTL